MKTRRAISRRASNRQSGLTLIETLMASGVLIVGLLALMGTFTVAMTQNWNQGDRATRTVEYAQDKMEQLMALGFTDTTSNTAVYPPTTTGGTGLTAGGGLTVGSPVSGYVDYVDDTGTQQTTSALATYIREWTVVNTSASLKTVTVQVTALITMGGEGTVAPTTTLVCQKSVLQ